MREYFLTALVTALVTYLLVPPVRRFAIRIGAAPEIRDRDVHKVPIPRLGGLAMFGGLIAGLLVASRLTHIGRIVEDNQLLVPLLAAGALIVLTGFLDDWWGMDAFIKLGGQIAAAGLLVVFGLKLPWIPMPKGGVLSLDDTLTTVITIMIVVITINAVNFVDGLDGLAAGIVCIAALATFAYSIALSTDISSTRLNATAVITSVLVGMCLGFLPHNFHPAKIFMGDTGAMLIGLVLASSMITVTPVDPSSVGDINRFGVVLPLLLPVAVMVLPLTDLITAVVRRTSQGMSPFAPDRGHLHHRLLDVGHSHRRTVLIMYLWTFLFAITVVGLSIRGVPLIAFPATVVLAVVVLGLMMPPRWWTRRNGRGGGAHAGGRSVPPGTPGRPQGAAAEPPGSTAAETSQVRATT